MIFDFENYKEFLRNYILTQVRGGRGQALKIAKFLDVHPTLISQILNGPKDLSLEQAHRLRNYLGLTPDEAEYWINLVLLERAGSQDLKDYFSALIKKIRQKATQVSKAIPKHQTMSEKEAGVYYSNWKYSALRLSTSIEHLKGVDSLAESLKLERGEVEKILKFLIETGILQVSSQGEWNMTEKLTMLTPDSPFFANHHSNWRIKAIEACSVRKPDELFISAPISISHEDFHKVRLQLLESFKKVSETVKPSIPEKLACLNIDFWSLSTTN